MAYGKIIGFLACVILTLVVMLGLNRHLFISSDIIKNTDSGSPDLTFADLSMAERTAFVTERCRDVHMWPEHRGKPSGKAYVFIDKVQELVACNNHKVGSTTISGLLKSLSNNTGRRHYRTAVLYHELLPEKINNLEFLSFMFVREPLRRLYSAYHAVKVKENSFEKFLTSVLNVTNVKRISLLHLSYYNTCRPCDVQYDYYGTITTFGDDMRYILKSKNISVDTIQHRNHRTMDSENWEELFINLPRKVKKAVWERYKEDYYLFGYPNPAYKYRRP